MRWWKCLMKAKPRLLLTLTVLDPNFTLQHCSDPACKSTESCDFLRNKSLNLVHLYVTFKSHHGPLFCSTHSGGFWFLPVQLQSLQLQAIAGPPWFWNIPGARDFSMFSTLVGCTSWRGETSPRTKGCWPLGGQGVAPVGLLEPHLFNRVLTS